MVDDGSVDRTTEVAQEHGARVLRLPFNLGIGGSVQTAFRYALENGFELAIRLDGDGQHDAANLAALVAPVLDDTADIAVGSRYLGDGGYKQCGAPADRQPRARRRRVACHAPARDGSVVRLPGAQPPRDHAVRERLSARVSGGGGDRARRQAPATQDRGAGGDARPPGGSLVSRLLQVRVLPREGAARAVRRPLPPRAPDAGGVR